MKKETPKQYRQRHFKQALDYAANAPTGITGNRQMAAAMVKAIKKLPAADRNPEL